MCRLCIYIYTVGLCLSQPVVASESRFLTIYNEAPVCGLPRQLFVIVTVFKKDHLDSLLESLELGLCSGCYVV